ncbi:Type 1 glutamine amidotransferase-like domain-containing protein [Sphingobium sp. SCG-1]|uniref:Type 1 glutamine amidotransferase-like domain-containing protein n=1 Tax=Sphingobium sp. SCG-1 TaxID=2072936 RepID=UPI001670205B|nr:Type 1 glutamine amidotransferase-like domain-containing protein [Sphingobium sp. SCG-1]
MAVLTNALDAIPLEAQLSFAKTNYDPLIYFLQNGFDPSLIDLRRYFGRPRDLASLLRQYRIIWALGGNSFLLRRAMRDSGFDTILPDLLECGIVYAGWSAGACVAGDFMSAVAVMDEPDATAPGYISTDPIETGLGLLPYQIIPHHESDHPEASAAREAVNWAIKHGLKYVPLRDGEVIVKNGGYVEVLPKLR